MDLFAYGTLMSPEIMEKVAGCRPEARVALLRGFRRSRVRDEQYPGIREEVGDVVPGLLYLDVPATAMQRLDIFEGERYERRQVVVQEEDGTVRAAMTYVFRPAYHELLTGIPWDFDEFLVSGKKKFEDGYFGFSELPAGEGA